MPVLIWCERKGAAFIQDRAGPNRAAILGVRLAGFIHNFADVVKLLMKEMMIPPQVTQIPLYIVWRNLGAIDTYWPLILPAYFGDAYLIFLSRQFFMTIPIELEEAAMVDGASRPRAVVFIILPQSLIEELMFGDVVHESL